MRKLIAAFSILTIVVFQACEGPVGPPGPPGFDGNDGVNIVSEVFEVDVNFTPDNDFAEVFLFEPAILPGDVVLTFIEWEVDNNNSIWRALPQNIFFEEGVLIYNYDFTRSDFRIFLDGPLDYSLLGPEWVQDQLFRVIVVPGDFSGARIDWTNYEAVTALLDLKDEDFKRINLN